MFQNYNNHKIEVSETNIENGEIMISFDHVSLFTAINLSTKYENNQDHRTPGLPDFMKIKPSHD